MLSVSHNISGYISINSKNKLTDDIKPDFAYQPLVRNRPLAIS